jgi:8-oxo-dGTP pyrophosphatase MutT (NUDIX family)
MSLRCSSAGNLRLEMWFMIEIWDAYDRHFNKLENVKIVRGEKIPDGMYHLVCEIIVKHNDGTYLLMQRDFGKHYGGMWELTASGSALVGETSIECAIRELREETGIVAFDLQEIKRVVHEERHSIYIEYLCITNCDKNSVILQSGETINYKWVNKKTILEVEANTLASVRTLTIIQETDI